MSYHDLENIPLGLIEWFYKRKFQDIIDSQKDPNGIDVF